MLQQGHQHLSSLTHFEPKLWVAAVAAAVSAATSGVTFHPAASQLVVVCQQVSCRRGELSGLDRGAKELTDISRVSARS